MTMKELIRREIERRIEWLNTVTNDFREGRRAELRSLYNFLDSLPDEPMTDCNELEEAAEDFTNDEVMIQGEFGGESVARKVKKAFIAGAEWHRKQDQDAIKTAEDHAFLAGAEWQKRKMMEGAAEGFVGVHLHDKRADVTVNSGYLPKEMGIKGDSKAKIIIVKEKEQ